MTQINPFTGAIIQSAQAQPRQTVEKERQIRRLQNLSKNAALQGDRLEHQVESTEGLQAMADQGGSSGGQNPQQGHEQQEEKPRIDLTA